MKILVTGGAGFIGSNLCEHFLERGNEVVCLDNFSTGKIENILPFFAEYPNLFKMIVGDIRNISDCKQAVDGVDYVLHEAALGSVPRSINDPITTNEVNINGFLNMLIVSRDANVKRFIYAASSSSYGDSRSLPKIEDVIGKPLSPYAVTKYVNELYADVFSKTYNMECIGLRYFNVFGKKQNPDGAYAAVIPLFIKQLINHESPIINGDGEHSRDFTYIKDILQINSLAINIENKKALNTVYNAAFGETTTLNQLMRYLKIFLSKYDPKIDDISVIHGEVRIGDIPHSLAGVEKAKQLLNYYPQYNLQRGLEESIKWYWEYLK